VQLDGAVVDKLALETRRALHKTPAFREDSEYMMLLSEHWETRMDENILRSEFKVRILYEHTCPTPSPSPSPPPHTRTHQGHALIAQAQTRAYARMWGTLWAPFRVPTGMHTHTPTPTHAHTHGTTSLCICKTCMRSYHRGETLCRSGRWPSFRGGLLILCKVDVEEDRYTYTSLWRRWWSVCVRGGGVQKEFEVKGWHIVQHEASRQGERHTVRT
jgi:hypothetical protein